MCCSWRSNMKCEKLLGHELWDVWLTAHSTRKTYAVVTAFESWTIAGHVFQQMHWLRGDILTPFHFEARRKIVGNVVGWNCEERNTNLHYLSMRLGVLHCPRRVHYTGTLETDIHWPSIRLWGLCHPVSCGCGSNTHMILWKKKNMERHAWFQVLRCA